MWCSNQCDGACTSSKGVSAFSSMLVTNSKQSVLCIKVHMACGSSIVLCVSTCIICNFEIVHTKNWTRHLYTTIGCWIIISKNSKYLKLSSATLLSGITRFSLCEIKYVRAFNWWKPIIPQC